MSSLGLSITVRQRRLGSMCSCRSISLSLVSSLSCSALVSDIPVCQDHRGGRDEGEWEKGKGEDPKP